MSQHSPQAPSSARREPWSSVARWIPQPTMTALRAISGWLTTWSAITRHTPTSTDPARTLTLPPAAPHPPPRAARDTPTPRGYAASPPGSHRAVVNTGPPRGDSRFWVPCPIGQIDGLRFLASSAFFGPVLERSRNNFWNKSQPAGSSLGPMRWPRARSEKCARLLALSGAVARARSGPIKSAPGGRESRWGVDMARYTIIGGALLLGSSGAVWATTQVAPLLGIPQGVMLALVSLVSSAITAGVTSHFKLRSARVQSAADFAGELHKAESSLRKYLTDELVKRDEKLARCEQDHARAERSVAALRVAITKHAIDCPAPLNLPQDA